MLLLDSRFVPRRERTELITTMLAESSGASVALEPHPEVHARMDLWQLDRVDLFRNASSGIALSSNPRQARSGGPIVALAVQERSAATHEQFGHQQEVAAGSLMMVDLTAPFAFGWTTTGASRALQLPMDDLDLPIDVIRAAGSGLESSPLARTVTNLVVDLFHDADRLVADPVAATVATTTLDLARALLATAGSRGRDARRVHHETLVSQIREHIRQNVRDPDLTPESIARAHHISLRHLHSVCAEASFSPQQWIVARRLEGARAELATSARRAPLIGAVARRWGFRDPGHFSRRFRQAYGLTPRDWCRTAAERQVP